MHARVGTGCGDCCRHRGTASSVEEWLCRCNNSAGLASHGLSLLAADLQGMLLFGPPGTGKTLIARQIGKMLNGKEPKVGVCAPLHRAAAHLQCVLPLSLSLNIPSGGGTDRTAALAGQQGVTAPAAPLLTAVLAACAGRQRP